MPRDELRDRIVHEAGRLFYREGLAETGVNRVATELGVSKRTLYELFDSKSELYATALDAFDARAFIGPAEALSADPEEQLLGLFEVLAGWMAQPGFRGCPYLNAAHELADPDHPARAVAAKRKAELRSGWSAKRARPGCAGRAPSRNSWPSPSTGRSPTRRSRLSGPAPRRSWHGRSSTRLGSVVGGITRSGSDLPHVAVSGEPAPAKSGDVSV
jgi:AcrR family transcriptional regulator